jgi:hypothetical protein
MARVGAHEERTAPRLEQAIGEQTPPAPATVIQTHLLRKDTRPLTCLTGTITGLIVLPHFGPRAALTEMEPQHTGGETR